MKYSQQRKQKTKKQKQNNNHLDISLCLAQLSSQLSDVLPTTNKFYRE